MKELNLKRVFYWFTLTQVLYLWLKDLLLPKEQFLPLSY